MRNKTIPYRIFMLINYSFLGALVLLGLLPFLHMFALSFSDKASVLANEVYFLPKGFNIENYVAILASKNYLLCFKNSIVRVVVGTIVNLVIIVLTAYPLAIGEKRLKGRNIIMWYFLFTMLFSGGMIPTFLLIRDLDLLNKFWVLILPGAVQVFSIVLMMNYMRGLPKELFEAAIVDGADHLTILFRVYFPISLPAVATLALLSIVGHWNSWFDGMIYLRSVDKWPLQTYLQSILADLQNTSQKAGLTPDEVQRLARISDKSMMSAQMFVSMIPVLLVYPFLQKYFVTGIRLGAVKG
ncbi:MAG: ABC transporter permease [Clostridiales bacterium GWC2_40_7]|nr:MAG: ABC transporter permease [Clostridiales bacterium GWC2_40_7]